MNGKNLVIDRSMRMVNSIRLWSVRDCSAILIIVFTTAVATATRPVEIVPHITTIIYCYHHAWI